MNELAHTAIASLRNARAYEPSDRQLQRSVGSARIVLDSTSRGNRIVDVFQKAPMRVFFPTIDGRTVTEAVIANAAGGLAGGDRIETAVTALARASIAVTSQAAEKIYRALSEPGSIATTLTASDAAQLAWLPQETIVFDGARFRRETAIELSSHAELLALEWIVLGRAARGEKVMTGQIVDSWRVRREGRLIWADTFRVTDEVFPRLHTKVLLGDYNAIGTLIYAGPRLELGLEVARSAATALPCRSAVTSVGGLVIARFAATAGSELKSALRTFLEQFGHQRGPGPFGVPKMWSC